MQGILKGELSLYHRPPVWLVWNWLYDNWQFLFHLKNRLIHSSRTGGQQYSDTSPFSIPCWMSLCWMSSCYVSLCWVSRRQPWRNKTVYNVGNRMSTFPTSSNFRMAMSRVANVPVRPIPAEQWTTMGGPGLSFCWKCYSTGFIRLWQGYKKSLRVNT
jgi:hypothetical protein